MGATLEHAKAELDILVKNSTDPENRPIIEPFIPEILQLIEKFGASGQSGGSAPYTAAALSQAIKKLCLQEPINPVYGTDDEWIDVTQLSDGQILFQNKRCSALFKDESGRSWYLDAIAWNTKNTGAWSGNAKDKEGNDIRSRAYVKSFPFEPKTFIIDVNEVEIAKDDWELYIEDFDTLNKAFEYYDRFDK